MKKLLDGKAGIITGGASGIGRAAAILFAQEGAKIVIADFNEAGGKETVELVEKAGGEAYFCYCDVRDEAQVKTMVEFAAEKLGSIDWAFNDAGVVPNENSLLHETTTKDYMRVQETNAHGVYYCMKYEVPYMLKNKAGAIVNVCSINSTCCTPNGVAYGTSKFAAYALTQCAALDYAKEGIRVNAIGPGPTKTPMIMQSAEQNPALIAYLESTIPDGRMGEAIECANAALYLISDFSTHITGQLLLVDGGQSVNM